LKARWGGLSKEEKALVVKEDKQGLKASKSRAVNIKYPFEVNTDDHCETSPDAYKVYQMFPE
jgi:hypothetical protein